MADRIKYKTINATAGATTIPTGLNRSQILCVSRQGEQKDDAGIVSLGSLNGSNYVFITFNKRISFGTSYPFASGEVIHIIYKVTL